MFETLICVLCKKFSQEITSKVTKIVTNNYKLSKPIAQTAKTNLFN